MKSQEDRPAKDPMEGFLDFLVAHATEKEPSPFFAARVCNMLADRKPDILSAILRLARPVIPVLASFSLVALAITYFIVPPAEMSVSIPEILAEPDTAVEQITVEQVLSSLSYEENGLER